MSEEPTTKPKKKWRKYVLIAAGIVLVILISPIFLVYDYQYEFVGRLLFGWFNHLKATAFPALVGNADSLWFPLLCLLVAGGLGHRFVRWWSGERGFLWKGRYTFCIFGLLLLGSAAAIALSGVVHQLAWMGTTKMTKSNIRLDLISQMSTLRQVGLVILEYVRERGEYPDSLEKLREMEVIASEDLEPMLYSEIRGRGPKESVKYRKPEDEKDTRPILIGAVYEGKVLCGFADGSARLIDLREFEDWMNQMQKGGGDER